MQKPQCTPVTKQQLSEQNLVEELFIIINILNKCNIILLLLPFPRSHTVFLLCQKQPSLTRLGLTSSLGWFRLFCSWDSFKFCLIMYVCSDKRSNFKLKLLVRFSPTRLGPTGVLSKLLKGHKTKMLFVVVVVVVFPLLNNSFVN